MIKKIILAGGCFWGLQDLMREQKGVVKTTVGYTGGNIENPIYENQNFTSSCMLFLFSIIRTKPLRSFAQRKNQSFHFNN